MTTEEWNEIYPIVTNEQKNIAIAEMLGYTYIEKEGEGYHGSSKGDIFKYKLWDCSSLGNDLTFLKFHSDANWQFEALDWIEKQGYVITILQDFIGYSAFKERKSSYWVNIDAGDNKNPEIILTEYFLTRKEAIFEALEKFSQYLKQKNL